MPSISVVMATHNGERFICQQLNSLLGQTAQIDELIVSDDGSTDRTLDILEEFAKNAPFRVSITRNGARLGYKENFMQAASLADCDLIAFCDQDDIWDSQKLSQSIVPFADPEVLLVHHDALVVTEDEIEIGRLHTEPKPPTCQAPGTSDPWCTVRGFTQVFRRSLLELSHLWRISRDPRSWDEVLAHDQWFYFVASVFGKVVYLDVPLASYRRHAHSTSGWRKPPSLLKRMQLRFEDRSTVYYCCSSAAKSRSEILATASVSSARPEWRARADEMARRYEILRHLYELRHLLYEERNLKRRAAIFGALLRANAYGCRGYWTFQLKGLAKDFILGIFLARLLKKYGLPANSGDSTCKSTKQEGQQAKLYDAIASRKAPVY